MHSSRIGILLFSALLSGGLHGCSGQGSGPHVSGSVLLDGQPLSGAEVRFIPKDDPNLGTHSTSTDPQGKFTLKADRNIPIKPGAYRIIVNKLVVQPSTDKNAPPGKGPMVNTVPAPYRDSNKTPLKAEIQEGSTVLPPFELKGSPKGQ